jgi:Biopolymer transport proteins
MRNLFSKVILGVFALGTSTMAFAQEAVQGGLHHELKKYFIDGSAFYNSLICIPLIFGLAICLERVIYLNLSEVNTAKLFKNVEDALDKGDVETAKNIARDTKGPVASIVYQGLMRIEQSEDVVERSVTSYGAVQAGLLEKNLSWITLFIAILPSIGFIGTVVGMILSFDKIQQVGDISPTVVAGGMKVALITTITGLLSAITLQLVYNYLLSKLEALVNRMEDSTISFMDLVVKYNLKYKK